MSDAAYDRSAATEELVSGCGYMLVRSFINCTEANRLRELVVSLASSGSTPQVKVTAARGDPSRRQVYNLPAVDNAFGNIHIDSHLSRLALDTLGRSYRMIAYFASVMSAGASGQEPHIDYPYAVMRELGAFPSGTWGGTMLNFQFVLMLSEFTRENGATGILPRSQLRGAYPTPRTFTEDYQLIEGNPGDLLVFNGLAWHGATANRSEIVRVGVVGAYVPWFVQDPGSIKPVDTS